MIAKLAPVLTEENLSEIANLFLSSVAEDPAVHAGTGTATLVCCPCGLAL